MGRRRNRRRNKSERQKFLNNASKRIVDEFLVSEEQQAQQAEHQKRIRAMELEILAKTIFVSNVLDLNNYFNLDGLKQFFEQYGPVKKCEPDRDTGRKRRDRRIFRARVQFETAQDAEKIFGGEKLRNVPGAVTLSCPSVGHKGVIKVYPSKKFDGMLGPDEKKNSIVELDASELSTGHWFCEENEMWLPDEDKCEAVLDEWLEESTIRGTFKVIFNLTERKVEVVHNEHRSSRDELNILRLLVSEPWDSRDDILSFRFKHLRYCVEVCQSPSSENSCWVIFPVKFPPRLEVQTTSGDKVLRTRSAVFAGQEASIFGEGTALKLCVSKEQIENLLINTSSFEKLKRFGIIRREFYSLQNVKYVLFDRIGRRNQDFLKAMASITDLKISLLVQTLIDTGKVCWHHTLNDSIHPKSLHDLVEDCFDDSWRTASAEDALQTMISSPGQSRFPCMVFADLVVSTSLRSRDIPKHIVPVFGLHLTVSRKVVHGFSEEVSNRLLRKLLKVSGFTAESFLRVDITEEDGLPLFGTELAQDVENKFRSQLLKGVEINGRLFHFLAYSSSQLKTNSFWMVSVPNEWSVIRIRRGLGDFSQCRTASLYAARVGQCLSTTFEGKTTTQFENSVSVGVIADVVSNTGMVHSDGTGLISQDAMLRLLDSLPLNKQDMANASCVQVRIGGAKGVLTCWDFRTLPNVPREFCSEDVLLRPSMIKFKADYSSIEVCKIGSTTTYHLNRFVILLLVTQGVGEEIFMAMQKETIETLCSMLKDRQKALEVLSYVPGPDSLARSTLLKMLSYGLQPSREPFLFSALVSVVLHSVLQLRKKARIPVRRGVIVMGGLDETGLVPEGCIFLRLQGRQGTEESGGCEPVVGPVMVTKHPAMYPGDVRMLLAVDIEKLQSQTNVLLFSRHGPHPEPHKMAGSDLDGDEYAVTWDPRLFLNNWNNAESIGEGKYKLRNGNIVDTRNISEAVPSLAKSNHDPLGYDSDEATSSTAPKELSPNEEDHSRELIDHLLGFIRNDNLGRISTMWLDYAAGKGATSDECKELAMLASIAVDFPKKGVPAVIPEHLKAISRYPRPHWREHKYAASYHCLCIIGRLYDDLAQRTGNILDEIVVAEAGRKRDRYGQITCRLYNASLTLTIYDISIPTRLGYSELASSIQDEMQLFANEERDAFEERVLGIMNKFNIRSEGELFTGCIRKFNKTNKKKQHDFKEEVRQQMSSIRDEFRRSFYQFVLQMSFEASFAQEGAAESSDTVSDMPGSQHIGHLSRPDVGDESLTEKLFSDDDIEWAMKVSTQAAEQEVCPESCCSIDVNDIRRTSSQLAAAYYNATYSPTFRDQTGSDIHLFMFPWIVAAELLPK